MYKLIVYIQVKTLKNLIKEKQLHFLQILLVIFVI